MPDTLLGGIAINEVLVDPNGTNNFDTDGNGVARGGDEFLELINTSGSAIDISGLELWDAGRDNWFTFPPGTVLEAGAVAVVVRNVQNTGSLPAVSGDDLAFDADFPQNVFNNSGDNIVVYDPANDEFIQATYNGDTLDDPTTGSNYAGFSSTATRSGSGEDFGTDVDGFSIQRGSNQFTNNSTPTPGFENVCFATGTLIETVNGMVVVEGLQAGDLVATKDHGFQPIRWIFANEVPREALKTQPLLRPIVVGRHVFGSDHALRVSRHHRLLVEGKIAQRMFGESQVLVPAKDLLEVPGVRIDNTCRPFSYFHVLLDDHQVLNACGVAAESLYLGPQAVGAMSADALNELRLIFPDLVNGVDAMPAARHLVSGRIARNLVRRHLVNAKPLTSSIAAH